MFFHSRLDRRALFHTLKLCRKQKPRMLDDMQIVVVVFVHFRVFGFELQDRKQIVTNKGGGLVVEMGTQYKGDVPMIQIIAVMDSGHWNFMPTAQMMWDFYKQFSRDPETKKLIYHGK